MAVGLRLYDANGNTILDETYSTGRVMGIITVDYAVNPNGNISDDRFGLGIPFGFALSTLNFPPVVTFSGNTMSWARSRNNAGQFPTTGSYRIMYGTY